MLNLISIASGGAIGALLRHLLIVRATIIGGTAFPFGTLFVNVIGSFLMGVIIGYLVKTLPHSMELRSFLTVGLLGGFTTFSAFSLDTITLFERGAFTYATLYVLSSVVFSLLSVFCGLQLIRSFF